MLYTRICTQNGYCLGCQFADKQYKAINMRSHTAYNSQSITITHTFKVAAKWQHINIYVTITKVMYPTAIVQRIILRSMIWALA